MGSARRRLDVYGIYFDFNRANIRQESEPVLRRIAEAVKRALVEQ